MITSKLTSKAQTTIPQPVRAALRLAEGDELAYEIDGGRVILTKASDAAPKTLSALSPNGTATPTGRLMPGFEQGDVIRVPFPYTDRSTRQRRPALVVSRGGLGEDGRLLWVAMITSAENRAWPEDVPFGDVLRKGGPSGAVPHSSLQTRDHRKRSCREDRPRNRGPDGEGDRLSPALAEVLSVPRHLPRMMRNGWKRTTAPDLPKASLVKLSAESDGLG